MTVDVAALLHDLGFTVGEGAGTRDWLLRSPDGDAHVVKLAPASERITAHLLRGTGSGAGRILFIGHSATPGVLDRAEAGQVDILTEDPPRAVIAGRIYEVAAANALKNERRTYVRPAWLRWAMERQLVLADEPMRQGEIAAHLGTSQQTISNAAKTLGPLVTDEGQGLQAVDKRALLDHFLDEYPGTGGQQFGWYALDSPVDQADHAAKAAALLDAQPLLSGDVAADRLGPWKMPTHAKVYISRPVDLADDGFVPAPLEEASLITCVPQDPTLWHLPPRKDDLALADPVLVCWDVLQGDDVDSEEAAEHLKNLIVKGTA